MPYVINRWDGTPIVTVEDGTVTQSLDVKLIGKNYAGYGEIQNENFIHLLENFAGAQSPVNAISGQIWYDTSTKKLKFHTGDQIAGVKIWKSAGGVEYGAEPTNPVTGDLWWDTVTNQLKVRQTTGWAVIGPQSAGTGVTQMRSRIIQGWPVGVNQSLVQPTAYSIIVATINDEVVYIVSKDDFVIYIDPTDATSNIPGYNTTTSRTIRKGLNLPYTDSNGKSSTSHVYWGTAALSKGLVRSDGTVVNADSIISESNVSFSESTQSVLFSDIGFKVGAGQDLHVYIESGTDPVIQNLLSDNITFKVNVGNAVSSFRIKGNAILPGSNLSYNLGSTDLKFNNIYAASFNGRATSSTALYLAGSPDAQGNLVAPTTTDTAWTVAVRDANKAITATLFNGDALRARYADLAEKYLSDKDYDIGTVIAVGGEKEVTASKIGDRAIGVVSENPAFLMNKDLDGGLAVALKGRVPVKVVGPIKKGQRLIAGDDGCAMSATVYQHSDVFAVSLEDNSEDGIKLVEAVIL
jgi:hypothetical protein